MPRFRKGQSGNPKGRPRVPEDVRQVTLLHRTEFVRLANELMKLDKSELKQRLETKGTPMIELMVGKIIWECVTKGDQQRLEFLLNRLIGRVPMKFNEEDEKNPLESFAEAMRAAFHEK